MFRCHLSPKRREKKGSAPIGIRPSPLSVLLSYLPPFLAANSPVNASYKPPTASSQRRRVTIDQGLARRIVATARSRTNFHHPKNRGPHGAGLLQPGFGCAGGVRLERCLATTRRTAVLPFFDVVVVARRGIEEPIFFRKPLGQHSLLAAQGPLLAPPVAFELLSCLANPLPGQFDDAPLLPS